MNEQFRERIFGAFGDQFFYRFVLGLFPVYEASLSEARKRQDLPFVAPVAGYNRWASSNKLLKMVGDSFDHVQSVYKRPKKGNSAHAVVSAKGVIMTCASTGSQDELPDEANYRMEMSANYNQLHLFDDNLNGDLFLPDTIYCVLVHGASKDNRKIPEWVKVVVPDKTMSVAIWSCDLLRQYWSEIKQFIVDDIEDETPAAPIHVKQLKKVEE